jgi:hypothetical protein
MNKRGVDLPESTAAAAAAATHADTATHEKNNSDNPSGPLFNPVRP